jgi:hypothetical protein
VRCVGVENVIPPIGVEDGAMAFTILPVGGFPVSGLEDCQEVGKEIDQHGGRYEAASADARETVKS